MAEQLNNIKEKIKEFWEKLTPKQQKIIMYVGAGVVVLALLLTVYLNVKQAAFKTIFPGMSEQEVTEVYATLSGMGVQPQIDNSGNLQVPAEQWEDLQYKLSAQGYPQTTLTYGTFSNMSGFTTTEFEKRVALTFQLQDRIQQTLRRWNGISDAAVTISIPEQSNFVWDQGAGVSTASVTVTMRGNAELTAEQVSAIKNHVASAVPKLSPQDVTVIDAATGTEPKSLEDLVDENNYSTNRLEFEREIEKRLEDNVLRLLTPTYGANGVTAVAKVVIDYDKMLTERREVLPGEEGVGIIKHREESYTVNGNVPEMGIVGEEYNTDVPIYPSMDELDSAQTTDLNRLTDYDIGYILTQIEKGEPILKEATIAVIVNDPNFTEEKEEILLMLVSRSVNIEPEYIQVSNLNFEQAQPAGTVPSGGIVWNSQTILIAAGIALLVLMLIVVIVSVTLRRRAKRLEENEAAKLEAEELQKERDAAQKQRDIEREISEHKRMLQEEAQNVADLKESAIAEEVREFAQRNPEITANLIRSLMKEDR